jgi:DNA polymerase-3 subunit alpha
VHFVNAAHKFDVKPIVGCELYVCKKDDHRAPPEGDTYNHLLVLAENDEGYRNLVKITSEASLHGFYYKPRVSKKFLAEHSRGLIGLSGCLKGEVAERLTEGNYEAARAAAGTFADIFGKENFFLEIQDQGLAMEHRIHPGLFQLEKDLGMPLVATNDSHYLCEEDAHAHEIRGHAILREEPRRNDARVQRRAAGGEPHAGYCRALQPAVGKNRDAVSGI